MKLFSIVNRFRLGVEKESPDYVKEQVTSGIEFKGTNLIILIFAIVIASVGLNVNSTAVIIGAMLISPLMGPIIGMGYALATYDFILLKRSLKNFTFAVVTSLIASTIYFGISPLNEAHSELLARTTPTIYDVMIALFGGFAGIVAASSKKKGNVIPGVAIATALMPPLCTAGYGIATAQWSYFFGALYLFNINTVFIALSTMLFARFLKFPPVQTDEVKIKRANRWVYVIVLLTVLPSIYLGYRLVLQDQFTRRANDFINAEAQTGNTYLLKSDIEPSDRKITLIFGGQKLSESQRVNLAEKLSYFELDDAKLVIKQGFALDEQGKEASRLEKYYNDIKTLEQMNLYLKSQNDSLLDVTKYQNTIESRIYFEAKSLYPDLGYLFLSRKKVQIDSIIKEVDYVFIDKWKSDLNKTAIINWLKMRLESDSINLIIENK